jgi:protein-disulfide isomerase
MTEDRPEATTPEAAGPSSDEPFQLRETVDGAAQAPQSGATANGSLKAAGGVTVPIAVPVTVALVLGLAVGLILGWVLPRPGDAESTSAEAIAAPTAESGTAAGEPAGLTPPVPTPVPGGPSGSEELAGLVIGSGDQVIEVFEDYVCPFCARLELSSGAQLREAALAGEFTLVIHPIAFLTEDSPRAANASACVYEHEDLNTWVAFHELVYERQDPTEAVGQYTNEILLGIADEVGAASEQTPACITDGAFTDWVGAVTQQSFERGVRGTPTVAVDGVLTDPAPLVQ